MLNQYSLLVKSDKTEFQFATKDAELGTLLNNLSIIDDNKFVSELIGLWNGCSSCRTNFYLGFNYKNKTYATPNLKIPYIVPTYGVKGADAIGRSMIYVNQYFQNQEDMRGQKFLDYVFGTNYIREEEMMNLNSDSEIIARFRKSFVSVSDKVQDSELVCRILVWIWDKMEKDPSTRVVLLLDEAEEQSMDLLRQIYSLLPAELRLGYGFETNVTYEDLINVSDKKIPIYLFTMSKDQVEKIDRSVFNSLRFMPEFLDIDSFGLENIDYSRYQLIDKLCQNQSPMMRACFNYAEHKVMEETKRSSSFLYFDRILNLLFSDELYWWTRKDINTLEELKCAVEEQSELMSYEEIRNSAMYRFYSVMLQEKAFSEEITRIIENDDVDKRMNVLPFVENFLHLKSVVQSQQGMFDRMVEQKNAELKKLSEEKEDEKQAALVSLSDQKEDELNKLKLQIGELQSEKLQLKRQNEDLDWNLRQVNDRNVRLNEENKRKEKEFRELDMRFRHANSEETERRLDFLSKESASRRDRISDLEISEKNLKKTCREMQHSIEKNRKGKIIAWVVAGVFVITTLGGGAFSLFQMSQVKTKNSIISSQNGTIEDLKGTNSELETEKERLLGEVKDFQNQIESMNTEIQESEETRWSESSDIMTVGNDSYSQEGGYLQLDNNMISLY